MLALETKHRPQMRFSVLYRESEPDRAARGDCLKNTGTRVKRDASGIGACTIGNGQVYLVEH